MSTRAKLLRLLGAVFITLALVPWLSVSTATADPPASGGGAISVNQGSLTDHDCDDSEWHFVITQIDAEANAPASIHVTFSDGAEVDIPLEKFTGGTAHYTLVGEHLDATVVSATATIYEGWSGTFNLSHGPCNTPTTPPSTPPSTPETTPPSTPPSTPETTPPSTPPSTPETTPPSTPPSTPETTPPSTPPATSPSGTGTSPSVGVLPTKVGNTGGTGVLGTKTGVLADTGLELSMGGALGLSFALVLAGGLLMTVPSRMAVERGRRH